MLCWYWKQEGHGITKFQLILYTIVFNLTFQILQISVANYFGQANLSFLIDWWPYVLPQTWTWSSGFAAEAHVTSLKSLFKPVISCSILFWFLQCFERIHCGCNDICMSDGATHSRNLILTTSDGHEAWTEAWRQTTKDKKQLCGVHKTSLAYSVLH